MLWCWFIFHSTAASCFYCGLSRIGIALRSGLCCWNVLLWPSCVLHSLLGRSFISSYTESSYFSPICALLDGVYLCCHLLFSWRWEHLRKIQPCLVQPRISCSMSLEWVVVGQEGDCNNHLRSDWQSVWIYYNYWFPPNVLWPVFYPLYRDGENADIG